MHIKTGNRINKAFSLINSASSLLIEAAIENDPTSIEIGFKSAEQNLLKAIDLIKEARITEQNVINTP